MAFTKYAQQEIKSEAIPVALPQIRGPQGPAVLKVLHAGDGNDAYMAEVLRDAEEDTKAVRAIREAKTEAEKDALKEARELRLRARYIKTIVKEIVTNVVHDDGTPATNEDIPEFVRAMPSHAFWALVAFCQDSSNWIDIPSWPEAAALAEK